MSPSTPPDFDRAAIDEMRALLDGAEGAEETMPAETLADLKRDLHAAVEAEDARPGAKLRQQPFAVRVGLAVFTIVLLVVGMFGMAPRADIAHYPGWRLALEALVYLGVATAGIVAAARGAHRPALPSRSVAGLAALSVLVVVVAALMPDAHHHDEHVSRGFLEMLSPCTFIGIAIALPCYALFRVIGRGSPLASVAAAAAAGLAANATLQMHCPVIATEHQIASHAAVVVWLIVGVVAVGRLERHSD